MAGKKKEEVKRSLDSQLEQVRKKRKNQKQEQKERQSYEEKYPFPCTEEKCDLRFAKSYDLKKHQALVHRYPYYYCQTCVVDAGVISLHKNADSLNKHRRNIHRLVCKTVIKTTFVFKFFYII